MLKFYYALIFCLFSTFFSQVQAQILSLSDLSAIDWKPASESLSLVGAALEHSPDKGETTASHTVSSVAANDFLSNRRIIVISIKAQLSQQSDVAQALYNGYNEAMVDIRQQPNFDNNVEVMCEKEFEYILSILKK